MGLGWNGSTFKWHPSGGADAFVTPLRGIQFQDSPAEIDIAGSADTTHIYRVGRDMQSLSFDIEGVPGAVVLLGGKGKSTVALNDAGSNGTFANAVITRMTCSGRRDADVTSSITMRPCNAP